MYVCMYVYIYIYIYVIHTRTHVRVVAPGRDHRRHRLRGGRGLLRGPVGAGRRGIIVIINNITIIIITVIIS